MISEAEANHHQRPQLHSLPSEDVPEAIINVKSEMPDSCTLDNMAMVNFFALFKNLKLASFNPNWHEAGHIPAPVLFGSDFWQLNFYQKFPNFFGGEN